MFVNAWSKTTGRHHLVPEHFLDNPVLSRDLTTVDPAAEPVPDESSTIADMKDYADRHNIDLAGAKKHDEILAAITEHHTSTTETPATGENQE